jgi:hypothetical protein
MFSKTITDPSLDFLFLRCQLQQRQGLLPLSFNADSLDLQSSITIFLSPLHLASCVLGLTKCAFVLGAHFARLRFIATIVVQDVAMRSVELVLYSTQYTGMIITREVFYGHICDRTCASLHMVDCSHHQQHDRNLPCSSRIASYRGGACTGQAAQAIPRIYIKLHLLKELGPLDAALDGLAVLQSAFATEHDQATPCTGQHDIDTCRFLHDANRALVVVAHKGNTTISASSP